MVFFGISRNFVPGSRDLSRDVFLLLMRCLSLFRVTFTLMLFSTRLSFFFCRVDFQSVFPSVPSDCRPCLLSRCQLSSLPSARLSMGGPGSISLGADTFVSYCFLAMPRPFMLTPSLSLVKLLFDSPSSPFLPRQIIVVKDKMKCLSTVCRLSCSFPSCRLTDPPLLWRFLVWIELAHV